MSTQQDIYAAGSESRPPMLNKENYVPWSSRLLRYAKSRPNGKLIYNSILNGLYVKKMIPEPGDANREITVTETFHLQTDDELSDKELKQIEADDQAIQTILLGLSEDIYAAVDSCETAQEIWLRVKQMMKGFDIGIQEKKAKLFNEWERFTSNEGDQLNITDPTTAMNMTLALMAKAFKLNYSTLTNNNQRISSNPRNRQIAQPGNPAGYNDVIGNHAIQNAIQNPRVQNVRNSNGLIGVQRNINQNQIGNEEYDLMAVAADLDEIEEVNANCILMANLQQASTSGTHIDSTPVYDIDGSAEFMGTVRFDNDHVAAIMGFGNLQWGNILITRVYFVKGLGHNLFFVGQFCDSDLEVAFRRDACFVRNLEGVDLLKGYRSTNLYTINLQEMASASPICLMARASSTKSWLWHQRLSHLNFDTINDLARNDLVAGLSKFKYHKEHLCPSCKQGKSKRASNSPKPVPNSRQRLHLLHMDLCGTMRIASTNEKRYVLVIVDDYSCYTWVHFLRSKDEAPEVIIKFQKRITFLLQSPVIIIRTDNGTKFKNQMLIEYFDTVGISHQMSSVRSPQQNGVVERRNRTLVEAARTMLIFFRAPLFLWAEAIATACFTQNRSIIHHIGKFGAKGDIGFFIGYFADSCAYRVYNRQTKKIMETMNISFDELLAMAFEQRSSKPRLNSMTSGQISSGLDLTYAPSTITTQQPSESELDLLFEAMYDDYIGGQPSATARTVLPAQEPQV
nr:retrovirus-related Pol polyprotein from transposon TNT 1-94 [Tanacetum cinerariifolium]